MKTLPQARPSRILGPNGQPAAMFLYPSPRTNPRTYRPRPWLAPSTRQNVDSFDRMELVNYSRQLRAQIDVLDAAVRQKNSWAFGDAWDPHYGGTNKEWGKVAARWLNEVWMPNCNVRGPQYGFKTSMRLSGIHWDVDGDDVMVFTQTALGFPQLAFYPSTKIASTYTGGPRHNTVQGGAFDGAKLEDGIIFDRNNRAVGVRIVGENGDFSDVSSLNCDLAYEPDWCDQGRGIPRIATSLLTWMNRQDIDTFIQRGIKRASAVGLIAKNEEGEGGIGNVVTVEEVSTDPIGEAAGRTVTYEEINGGEMYYLSSSKNESLEALEYENPHPNTEAYIERMTRGALSSVGWFFELMDLSETGRAPSRILVDLANQSIWDRQQSGERRWRRAIVWAIAKGMKTGQIPENRDGVDAYLWTPGLPKPLSVDAGHEATADREALKMGLTTRSILAQKNHGRHYEALDEVRDREIRETVLRAEKLSGDHPWLDPNRALELYEQRSPNPTAQQQESEPAKPRP